MVIMAIQNRLRLVMDSTAEIHAFQDGLVIGAILALSIHYPPALALIAAAVGIEGGLRPGNLIDSVDKLVRKDDIEKAREYFITGLIGGLIIVSGVVLGALELGLLEFVRL